METEFYLTLILGQRTFEHIYSEVPPHYKVNGYNFYEGVRQYHSHLQQRVNQSSLEIRKVMTAILLDTAIKLSLIEQKKKNIEQVILDIENSQHDLANETPGVKQNVLDRENLDQLLLKEMRDKSQVFANQSWTMILFEEVLDDKGNTLLLKDLIIQVYKDYLSLVHIDLEDDQLAERSNELLDHIHIEIQSSLDQASRRMSHVSVKLSRA